MDAGSTTRGLGAMWPWCSSVFFQELKSEGNLEVDPEVDEEERDVVDML